MHPLPHRYQVLSNAGPEGDVVLCNKDAANLYSQAPPEFGGPGHCWSPETLLVAAVADCYILTFRSLARSSSLPWQVLSCRVDGTLARSDRGIRFTAFELEVRLTVPSGSDEELAARLLERAEQNCLISNSLNAVCTLKAALDVAACA